jgi:pimeloyl-ACP methyl ester carboxylesterase
MKIYFSHGKSGTPQGNKIKRMAKIAEEYDYKTDSIDYTDTIDPDLRADRLYNLIKNENEPLLVGSSMGGYASLVVAEQVKIRAMFLLAPALYMPGYKQQIFSPDCPQIEIIHGWSDTVVPVNNSIKFAGEADCTLHLISGDHKLNSSIEVVADIFDHFLRSIICG